MEDRREELDTHGPVPRSGSARPERNGWDMNLFMLIHGGTLSKYFPHWGRRLVFDVEFVLFFFRCASI